MPLAPQPHIATLQAELKHAVQLHQRGQLDEAEARYLRILDKAPSQPDALNLLGVIYAERNRNEKAIELLARAARLRPKDGTIWNNLGRACVRARRFEQAIDALELAISLSPDLVEALGNLIQAHRAAGNVAEAGYYIERLRRRKDGSITADYEQARLLGDLGRKEEARALLMRLVGSHPQFGPAWQALARMGDATSNEALADAVQAAIADASEPSSTMKFLCYAAGKIFDDLGEYDRAFDYFQRAKAQDPPTYDAQKTAAQFRAIQNTFDQAFVDRHRNSGIASDRPVFIVGMPRSGTSLAEQILASHPKVHGGGELEFVAQLTSRIGEFAQTGGFPEAAATLGDDAFAAMGFRYLRKIAAIDPTAERFTDKMPHNFLSIGLLAAMFQNLRIIHCLRHPFDTCLSCYMHDFAHSHDYNQSLEGLASYYVLYRDLMAHWSDCLGPAVHTLRYEHLLADQRGESAQLLAFTELAWDDSVVNFSTTDRRVSTPSSWQVRRPLYQSSSGRWKNYERHILPALGAIPDAYFP